MYAQNYKKCKCGFDFRKCLHLQISFGFCALLFANMHVNSKYSYILKCVWKNQINLHAHTCMKGNLCLPAHLPCILFWALNHNGNRKRHVLCTKYVADIVVKLNLWVAMLLVFPKPQSGLEDTDFQFSRLQWL